MNYKTPQPMQCISFSLLHASCLTAKVHSSVFRMRKPAEASLDVLKFRIMPRQKVYMHI